jgi:hypothetical protein
MQYSAIKTFEDNQWQNLSFKIHMGPERQIQPLNKKHDAKERILIHH